MLRLITFPFRAAWWAVRTASLSLLWLIGSRLFLLIPIAIFVIPLSQGQNVPAEAFYPLFFGTIGLHFLARAIWRRLPAKRLPAPKMAVPKAPPVAQQPVKAAPQPALVQPPPYLVQPPAAAPVQRTRPQPKPRQSPLPQTSFPPFSPVKQLLRPMNPQHSPTPAYALSRLPEAVRRMILGQP